MKYELKGVGSLMGSLNRWLLTRGNILGKSILLGGLLLTGGVRMAHGQATLTSLVVFNDTVAPKGSGPSDSLVQGKDGLFYGTTSYGGAHSQGTVFRVSSNGVFTTLVEFNDSASPRGENPHGSLVQGTNGNFYGTTLYGGLNGRGTIFQMTPGGVLTTLVDFNGNTAPKGENPYASLIPGADGNLYGMTSMGGAHNIGTIFKMTPAGVLTTLVEFAGNVAPKGGYPGGNLTVGTNGNFYGMTAGGGLTTLVEFNNHAAPEGGNPYGGLLPANDGYLYGVTYSGGTLGYGTVFRMTPAGALTTLVEFGGVSGTPKGANPSCTLIQGRDGLLYGTTLGGGAGGWGTIFSMTTGGTLTTLVEFNDNSAPKGYGPHGALVQGTDANFYGMTYAGGTLDGGTAFKLALNPPAILKLSSPSYTVNQSGLRLSGVIGLTYTIQATQDFVTWTPVGTQTLSSTIWDFVDTDAGSYGYRFYRAVIVP